MSFSKNIQPYVEYEIARAEQFGPAKTFTHLENAHVLGQASTKWHTLVHCKMLLWAIRQGQIAEIFGQLFRIVGAATKTVFGLVPRGNTGGANVSPFKPMPISAEHAAIFSKVSAKN